MHNEKKIMPVLYPSDRSMTRKWFIKYRTECYVTGKLIYKKYTGALNLEPDPDKRMALAVQYMQAMQSGQPLPNVQGQRCISADNTITGFASVIKCTSDYVANHTHALRHSTRLHYRSKVKALHEWLHTTQQTSLTIGGMHSGHVQQFIQWLKRTRQISNTTCNDYKHILSTIWQQFIREKKILVNPFSEVKDLRSDTEHLTPYTEEIENTIIKHLPDYDNQLWIFLQFVYYCAIRPGRELRLLKLDNIDFINGTITVPSSLAKNYRKRIVNIPNILMQQIAEWNTLPKHYFLFTPHGIPGESRAGNNYFSRRFDSFRKSFGIHNRYKLYASKHTMNRKMAMKYNAVVLQNHNGHSSLSETQKYIGTLNWHEMQFLKDGIPKIGS